MKDYVLLITMHADPAMPPGYNEWGGTHTYMHELLDECGKAHVPCILITRKSMKQLPAIEQVNPYCVIYRIRSGDDAPMDKTRLKDYHQLHLTQILDIITKHESKPKVIHSVYWNSGRLAVDLSNQLNIPFVHSIISNSRGRVLRGAVEPIPDRAKYEQDIYNKAARLICVSEDERNDLVQLYNIPANKIVVAGQYIHSAFLFPAHDTNDFPRMNSNISYAAQKQIADSYNSAFLAKETDSYWAYKAFTYIGRMDMNKGLEHILSAWKQLLDQYHEYCPPLWLVGGSLSEISNVRSKIKPVIPELCDLEKKGRIIWWGCLDPVGLSTILLKSSILLTHSLYEPGGRVAIEAMSEGVPVLATPNGFARDSIRDWQEGFIIKHGDSKTLAHRMEHFIRQPYLSNALGMNAKHTAKAVVDEWNFWEKHLACYNGTDISVSTNDSAPLINSFDRRRINLFPFCTERYSEELLLNFFTSCTKEHALQIDHKVRGKYSSDVCRIVGEENVYYIKRFFTRLAISPMFNPVCKDEFTRHADKRYRVELNAYLRQNSPILMGHDDFHCLLLLRELDPYAFKSREDLIKCAEFLLRKENALSSTDAKKYYEIITQPKETLENLNNIMRQLGETFSEYYFEPSGMFDVNLCWKIAPHLVQFNRRSLSADEYIMFSKYVDTFSSYSSPLSRNRLRDINTDLTLKHFKQYKGSIQIIDLEKTSIGIVEHEIAELLCGFVLQHEESCEEFWRWTTQSFRDRDVSLKDIMSYAAFYLFYECIIGAVLQLSVPSLYKHHLDYLYNLFPNI